MSVSVCKCVWELLCGDGQASEETPGSGLKERGKEGFQSCRWDRALEGEHKVRLAF